MRSQMASSLSNTTCQGINCAVPHCHCATGMKVIAQEPGRIAMPHGWLRTPDHSLVITMERVSTDCLGGASGEAKGLSKETCGQTEKRLVSL